MTQLDELERLAATGDGDATGQWANDEGKWVSDHVADLANQPGALGEYTTHMLALLTAVGDGSDQTDAIKDLLALRDEIATSAGIAVATPKPTSNPTAKPVSYATLSSRAWALIVKSPDKYVGNHYVVWGCISQFDAATGSDTFRAQASYKKVAYWYTRRRQCHLHGRREPPRRLRSGRRSGDVGRGSWIVLVRHAGWWQYHRSDVPCRQARPQGFLFLTAGLKRPSSAGSGLVVGGQAVDLLDD